MTAVVSTVWTHHANEAFVALALARSLNLVVRFQWTVRQLADTEI
jgi:hypothetical protein